MDALLSLRRIGDVFGFVILLRHREQLLHLNRTELLASVRNPVDDRNVVGQVQKQEQASGDRQQTGGAHSPF